jgi:hypothetical protein
MNESADIVEIVPGRGTLTLTIDRLETYTAAIMELLSKKGGDGVIADFEDLSQITDPIEIEEKITGPASKGSPTRTIVYAGCWAQTWSKTIQQATTTVTEHVTLWPTRIYRK